jgi:hypothetical protein
MIRPVAVGEFADRLRPNGKADLLRQFALPFAVSQPSLAKHVINAGKAGSGDLLKLGFLGDGHN